METVKLILPLAWRNLWRNKRRSVLTMLAIFVAVLSMVCLGAFMRAWSKASLIETINNLTGHGQIHAMSYLDDPSVDHRIDALGDTMVAQLESNAVSHYAARVRVPAMLKTERENAPVELYGIDPQAEQGLSFIADAVEQGSYFSSSDERGILLGGKLADRLQTKLGRRLVVMAQGADGSIHEAGYRIVGIFKAQPALEKNLAFVTLPQSQSLLGLGSDFSEVAFRLSDDQQLANVLAGLRQADPELDVRGWDELDPFTKAMVEMGEGSILIWIFVSFAVVSFGLVSTLLTSVFERMREFGLLQAVGMQPRWLMWQVLAESVFMVAVATLAGVVIGALVIMAFTDGVDLGTGANYFGAAQMVYPQIDWNELMLITGSVIFLGVLASIYPAIKASRQVPVEVLTRANN